MNPEPNANLSYQSKVLMFKMFKGYSKICNSEAEKDKQLKVAIDKCIEIFLHRKTSSLDRGRAFNMILNGMEHVLTPEEIKFLTM